MARESSAGDSSSVLLPEDVATWLDEHPDKTATIDIRKKFLEAQLAHGDAATGDIRELSDTPTTEVSNIEENFTRVAHAVVSIRDGKHPSDSSNDQLCAIRRTATCDEHGRAECAACCGTIYLGVRPEAACPHCNVPTYDIVEVGALDNRPTLVGKEVRDE